MCRVWGTCSYRIERQPPQLRNQCISAPEPRCQGSGGSRNERWDNETGDSETKTESGSSSRTDAVCYCQTENVAREVSRVECDERWETHLTDDVFPSVDSGAAHDLEPHNEEQCQAVDPCINRIEQVESELCGVHERQEEWDKDDYRGNHCSRRLLAPSRIANEGRDRFKKSKGRADSQKHDGEEEQDSPEGRSGNLSKSLRVGQESDREGSKRPDLIWEEPEVAYDTEHRKGYQALVETIRAADDQSILDRIGVLVVVGSVRCEVAESDADREENLTTGCLPDVTACEFAGVPLAEIKFNSLTGIWQRCAASDKDDGHHQR